MVAELPLTNYSSSPTPIGYKGMLNIIVKSKGCAIRAYKNEERRRRIINIAATAFGQSIGKLNPGFSYKMGVLTTVASHV